MTQSATRYVKHGGSNVMTWVFMTANGMGSLLFINNVTADRRSRMNSEVYRAILPAHIQPNATKLIGQFFPVQMKTF